ncbi:excalibur calcium-binding domain-containing protein [Streptomyces sp. SPB162]|uniref:excalibur calcium-binding domain-containing protein n=1 Tax=Streptomyces sp. SPB162 TaxID=2940560 RepID=UPI002405524B|nr:excalibur calcium-binding domain-containing protein [Streptomyces sp. SPB162]
MSWKKRLLIWLFGLVAAFIDLGVILQAIGVDTAPTKAPSQSPSSSAATSDRPATPTVPAGPEHTETPTQPVTPSQPPTPTDEPPTPAETPSSSPSPEGPAYFRDCDEARAAGAAPLFAGDPGYRSGLDRDGDGVACEPKP